MALARQNSNLSCRTSPWRSPLKLVSAVATGAKELEWLEVEARSCYFSILLMVLLDVLTSHAWGLGFRELNRL